VVDKQSQKHAKNIWGVKGLLLYHWKVYVLDAEPRLADALIEYLRDIVDGQQSIISRIHKIEIAQTCG
jgi:hypothetical protein